MVGGGIRLGCVETPNDPSGTDESRKTIQFNGLYVILPQFFERQEIHQKYEGYRSLPERFAYRSDTNDSWLTVEDLQGIIHGLRFYDEEKKEKDTVHSVRPSVC